jgi:hypothetical protein
MNKRFFNSTLKGLSREDPATAADRIRREVEQRNHDLRKYHSFIEERFLREKAAEYLGGGFFHAVHLELVGMRFAGFATTNYDRVLEDALQSVNDANASGASTSRPPRAGHRLGGPGEQLKCDSRSPALTFLNWPA